METFLGIIALIAIVGFVVQNIEIVLIIVGICIVVKVILQLLQHRGNKKRENAESTEIQFSNHFREKYVKEGKTLQKVATLGRLGRALEEINEQLMFLNISHEEVVECNLDEIEKDIIDRDYRDMNREISPLKQADDAILVDSSNMGIEEVVSELVRIIEEAR